MNQRKFLEGMNNPAEISKMKCSILSEDGTLKYDFMTSLQKISMARIVSSLWMNRNTQQEIAELYRQKRWALNWRDFEDIKHDIVAKISQLSLPSFISHELMYLVSALSDVIFDWITYHNLHVFMYDDEYIAADFIHNITWTARGKIDYLQTATNILTNSDSRLSDDQRYILACIYCLEEEITALPPVLVNRFYMRGIFIDELPMMYFWTAHITGDMTELSNPLYYRDKDLCHGDMSNNERIMQLLIKSEHAINDAPIIFMWNKLSEEERAKTITFLVKNVQVPDFVFSLMASIDCEQQQNILKECSDAVLGGILKDWWWWGEYFLPTALNVLDIMDPPTFWKVLRLINEKKNKTLWKNLEYMYDHYKSLFKWFWQEGSAEFKEFIIHDNVWPLKDFVQNGLIVEQDMDVIEVIFKDLNKQQIKIAFGEYIIRTCAFYIELDKWDVVDRFIKCTHFSEEDVNDMKEVFMLHTGRQIATCFLKDRKFHRMQRFMNWAFKSEEEITNFQQSLNYTAPP